MSKILHATVCCVVHLCRRKDLHINLKHLCLISYGHQDSQNVLGTQKNTTKKDWTNNIKGKSFRIHQTISCCFQNHHNKKFLRVILNVRTAVQDKINIRKDLDTHMNWLSDSIPSVQAAQADSIPSVHLIDPVRISSIIQVHFSHNTPATVKGVIFQHCHRCKHPPGNISCHSSQWWQVLQ